MYTVKRSIPVYKNEWMALYEDLVNNEKQSTTATFNRIIVQDAVIIVPIFADGSLLIVESYRHGIRTNILELPGGLINKKDEQEELPDDAAKRELLEETGYISDTLEFNNWFYTWPGRGTQKNFVFVAKGLKKIAKQDLEDFEYAKVCVKSREQIIHEIKSGRIKSAITISALLHGYFI
jgi:ADP-ribose pyrophosphatase